MSGKISITTVVIGLNESENLERCFNSIRLAFSVSNEIFNNTEIIFVDSGSTDDSLIVAERLVDRLFCLRSLPSASSARSVGLREAVGDFVLFLDGDMELHCDFLAHAMTRFISVPDENLVGIIGIRDDIYIENTSGTIISDRRNVYKCEEERIAPHFGGALLAHRNALLEAGGYRPDLKSSEEPDLYSRLLNDGKYIVELPIPFIRHYTPPPAPSIMRALKMTLQSDSVFYWGMSFLYALKGGYIKGFSKVFKRTLLVWCADIFSFLFFFWNGWVGVAGVYLLLIVWLFFIGKPQLFVTSRLRLYGMMLAVFRIGFSGNCNETIIPQYDEIQKNTSS